MHSGFFLMKDYIFYTLNTTVKNEHILYQQGYVFNMNEHNL